ncbi:hypothetical protein [Streptomyces beijiangensis]|uniref:Uncharacterized protein n=1 Tax=Streptomyces beijiangensis TaxID=163361 RepID=A0A939F3Z6_9ACTN|nr:hypothetical protein [Streptomyces beijiangensis]MBO0511268.1 hypothetical protein [Streptomyces beijiangensis]
MAPNAFSPAPGGPTVLGRAAGAGFLILALLAAAFTAYQGANTAGWIGTHGELTVQSCDTSPVTTHRARRHGSSRHVTCYGTFVSDDGKIRDINAQIEDGKRRYLGGAKVSVQRTGAPTLSTDTDASYVITAPYRAGGWFAGFFGSWLIFALGLLYMATGHLPAGRNKVSFSTTWDAAGRGRVRAAAIVITVAGLVGAAVAFLVGLVA